MKHVFIRHIALIILLTSCYEPYFQDTDLENSVLVVDGMITDEAVPYHIRLSYATSYNSGEIKQPVGSATVFVTDTLGNNYPFSESTSGDYVSDPAEFAGIPGNTYTLHIITKEGVTYMSESQLLYPEVYPDSVYAAYAFEEILDNSTGSIVTKSGADILTDIGNRADTLLRFRYTADLVTQYLYVIELDFQPPMYFYCWQTRDANSDINLTGEKYSVDTASINNHIVCFIEDADHCYARTYLNGSSGIFKTDYYQFFEVYNRIIYINQYSLNSEAYAYYSSIDEQLRSEGKIFDPIAIQLNGNIKCITNTGKKALGFFETSSVSNFAYKIDFKNLNNAQPSLIKVPYILPDEYDGCLIDAVPPFWVY